MRSLNSANAKEPQGLLDTCSSSTDDRSNEQHVNPASVTATTVGLTLGCVGLLMLGLQPLLLGALLEEHRLSVAQLTQAATAEILAVGVVAGALGGLLSHRHLRGYGLAGCLVLTVANAACLHASGLEFVAWRAVCGAGGGILVWIATGLITHGRSPGRLYAIFFGAQAVSQGVAAALLPAALMRSTGDANSGLAALAVLSLLSIVLITLLPPRLVDLPKQKIGRARLDLRVLAGLAGGFLFMAGSLGLFVFIESLAAIDHITPSVARFAVAWNLAAQLAGSALAAGYARRFRPALTIVCCCVGFLLCVTALAGTPHDAVFLGATLLFGFIWMFGLPYFVPLLIDIDPTRRSALLVPGALLLGGSAGPQLTGWFATETNLEPVLASSALLVAGCLISTVVAASGRRKTAPAP